MRRNDSTHNPIKIRIRVAHGWIRATFMVLIWPSKKEMFRHLGINNNNVEFGYTVLRYRGDGRSSSRVIEVNLVATRLTHYYVVHEFTHASMFWAEVNNVDTKTVDGEEYIAAVMGRSVENFWKSLKRRGIEFEIHTR